MAASVAFYFNFGIQNITIFIQTLTLWFVILIKGRVKNIFAFFLANLRKIGTYRLLQSVQTVR